MKIARLLKPLLDEIEAQQPQSRTDAVKKPRRHKRVLGVRFPTAYALQYKRFIAGYIKGLKKELDLWTKNDLTPALKMQALVRGDSQKAISRRHDAVEDIEQKLDDLMLRFGGVLAEEALRQQVTENAREILQYAERGWQRTIHTITGVDPLVRNLPMQEIVKAHVHENISLIKSIPQKLHGDVERVVMDGVRAGRKIDEITEAVQGVYPVTAKRAGVIARDQAGSLHAAIVDEQYKQANLVTYIWRTMKDSRVRGNPVGKYPNAKYNHWTRDGQVFSSDDPPPDGHPGEAIECRCFRQVQEAEVLEESDQMVQPGEYYDEPLAQQNITPEEFSKQYSAKHANLSTGRIPTMNGAQSVEQLRSDAMGLEGSLKTIMANSAELVKGDVYYGPTGTEWLKSADSITKKLAERSTLAELPDTLRGTVLINNIDDAAAAAKKAIEGVKLAGGKMVEVSDMYAVSRDTGYVGIHLNFALPGAEGRAVLTEIQIHTAAEMVPKELSHKIYEAFGKKSMPVVGMDRSREIWSKVYEEILH